jgi:hypothetical protein
MRTTEKGLTVDRLREVLSYNADTGALTWRITTRGKIQAGRPAGSSNGNGYTVIKIDGKRHMAHRLAWGLSYGEFPDREVDHVNTVRDDNRLMNLRLATPSENRHNASGHRDSALQMKGVTPSRGLYQAQIKIGGRKVWLGRFLTQDAAHAAYRRATVENFGAFARA